MDRKKCQVWIMLGQSNAVGHGLPMAPEDRIETPLKHVFGLHRDLNQSFEIDRLCWSGYTSGGMNLGETQDHTYSVPNYLAAGWQRAVDAGAQLPELYIIQIAIGAQGVLPKYMWHPDYEKVLIPGKLGKAKIGLYHLCMHIFSLVEDSFRRMGKDYEIMGIHWRGGENDAYEPVESCVIHQIYRRLLRDFRQALGKPAPVVLHTMACHERMTDLDATGFKLANMHAINRIFRELAEDPLVETFDVTKCRHFIPNIRGNGIFKADMVHFTPEVNRWVAEQILQSAVTELSNSGNEKILPL